MAGEVIDLETPTPPPDPPPVPPAVVAPPDPPPDPDEVGAVEIQGGKHVPLEALKAARAEAKQAKEAASRLPAMEQELAQLRGSLQTFQQVSAQLQQQARPTVPSPTDDPELVELARSLDYFTADGKPDLARAGKHAQLIERHAQKIAERMVGPIQQQSHMSASQANFQSALAMVPENLRAKVTPQLQQFWQTLPANMTADPRVAAAMPALAIGLDVMQGNGSRLPPQPPPNAHPPLVTEGLGSAPRRSGPVLTEGEQAVIRNRGMSDKKYQDLTKDFVKGRTNTLEDD